MTTLQGASVLVTGASRGIGRAIALALAEKGARLLLTSRAGARLEKVAGATASRAVTADLSRPDEVDGLAEAARQHFGAAPEFLVNAAGCFELAPITELTRATFERHLALNLLAPFLLVRAFLPELISRGSGHFVHIGSIAGRKAFPENAAYSASKYGLRGLHEVLRLELQGTGVRTTLIEPGPVDTDAWRAQESRLGADLPRRSAMLLPQTVARAVLFCLEVGGEGGAADVLLLPT